MTNSEQSINAQLKRLLVVASVLVAVGAFLLVWVPYQRQMRLIEDIEAMGGTGSSYPVGPDWLRQLVGDDRMRGFQTIEVVVLTDAPIDDAWLKRLSRLSSLRILYLNGAQIGDDGLKHLAGLTSLEALLLDRTQVSDDGVKELQRALPDCGIMNVSSPSP